MRASDTMRLHIAARAGGFWVAFRLSDGGSDGQLYPDRATAMRWQLHETQCAYVPVPWDDFSPRVAEIMLRFFEQLYDAGMRPRDPNDPYFLLPERMEHLPR